MFRNAQSLGPKVVLPTDLVCVHGIHVHPHTKFGVHISNGSALRVLTDGHTDGKTGPILLHRLLTWEVKIIKTGSAAE